MVHLLHVPTEVDWDFPMFHPLVTVGRGSEDRTLGPLWSTVLVLFHQAMVENGGSRASESKRPGRGPFHSNRRILAHGLGGRILRILVVQLGRFQVLFHRKMAARLQVHSK